MYGTGCQAASAHAKVVGLADAGFFLDAASYSATAGGHEGPHVYTEEMAYLFNMSMPVTNTACMAAHDAGRWATCNFDLPFRSLK